MNKQLEARRENRQRNLFDLMNSFDDLFGNFNSPALQRMQTDVQENEQAYVMTMDMPGVSKEDIQIKMEGNLLIVEAEKQSEKNIEGEQEGYSRRYRHYQQSFTLPATVSSDKIEAHYENGVLELFIPKSEKSQAKKIEIQSGKGGFLNRLIGKAQGKQDTTQTSPSAKH